MRESIITNAHIFWLSDEMLLKIFKFLTQMFLIHFATFSSSYKDQMQHMVILGEKMTALKLDGK